MAMKDIVDRVFGIRNGSEVYLKKPYRFAIDADRNETMVFNIEGNDPTYFDIAFQNDGVSEFLMGYGTAEGFYLYQVSPVDENLLGVSFGPTGTFRMFKKFGYAPFNGVGGAVTQLTGITTGVEINTPTGQITTVAAPSIAAGEEAEFTVTNNKVAATDVVILNMQQQFTDGVVVPYVKSIAAGSFVLGLTNIAAAAVSAGTAKINFAVIMGQVT